MRSVKVWDPLVRLLHWATAILFLVNFTTFEEESRAHDIAGYVLFGLVLSRLVWGLIGAKHARFSAFWPNLKAIKAHFWELFSDTQEVHLSHNPLGAVMVYNLLITLVLISLSGIAAIQPGFIGGEWMEEVHEFFANYALACVGLHIAGVLFEQKRSKINLIRAMITGRKDIPDT